jgi:hypothetical protein
MANDPTALRPNCSPGSAIRKITHCPGIKPNPGGKTLVFQWVIFDCWRSRRDSNPRYGFWPYNGLANRRLQPLGHDSVASTCRRLMTNSRYNKPKPPRSAVLNPRGTRSGSPHWIGHVPALMPPSVPIPPASPQTVGRVQPASKQRTDKAARHGPSRLHAETSSC